MFFRNKTKVVKVGNLDFGGSDKIYIQSMCNTKTIDVKNTITQIKDLEKNGCELVRISIPDEQSAKCVEDIKNNINIPLVADIHFDYKLALMCIERGIDKIRINPGNIDDKYKIKILVDALKNKNIPIRIGVNSGSLNKKILKKYNNQVTSDGLVESAIENIKLLEEYDFYNIIISIKSSSVMQMVDAYEKFASIYNYPLHLGLTEAGTLLNGSIKSSVALGILLNKNIGNTIRVSLTSDPIEEVKVAKTILKSLNLYNKGFEVISCPTCARTNINIIELAKNIEQKLEGINTDKNIKVAIMGCAVNGPGEASNADIGIAGGINEAILFKKGKIIRKINENNIVEELLNEIINMC